MRLIPHAHRKLEFGTQTDIDAQAGYKLDIIDLMLNNVAVVRHRTPLLVDLCADNIPLVIDLVAGIAGIILVVPKIETGIAGVTLKSSHEGRAVAAPAAVALLQELVVVLHADRLALSTQLIAAVGDVILVETAINSRIAVIALTVAYDNGGIAKIVISVQHLVIVLYTARSRSHTAHRPGRSSEISGKQQREQNTTYHDKQTILHHAAHRISSLHPLSLHTYTINTFVVNIISQ